MPEPWWYFLEDYPERLYQGVVGDVGSKNFLDYWRGQYGNVFGKYQGQLGQMALGGQAPDLTFYNYLMQNPLQQQWSRLAPWARGERGAQSLRWLIPR